MTNETILDLKKPIKDYTAEELYNSLDLYSSDEWVDSPEFIELQNRLRTISIEELREQGYYIPAHLENKKLKKLKII